MKLCVLTLKSVLKLKKEIPGLDLQWSFHRCGGRERT